MYDMKQVVLINYSGSQTDFGQVDFYSYLPKGQVKENGDCSTSVTRDGIVEAMSQP